MEENCSVRCESLKVNLKRGVDIKDITSSLERITTLSEIQDGMMALSIIGSTGSLTTIENEPGVVADLARIIEEIAPEGQFYEHEKAWHDGNGHSHVQAALLGPSISIPIRKGRLALGTWQQVVAINHDNKPRERKVEITIFGWMRQ